MDYDLPDSDSFFFLKSDLKSMNSISLELHHLVDQNPHRFADFFPYDLYFLFSFTLSFIPLHTVADCNSILVILNCRKKLTRLSVNANGSLIPTDSIDRNLIKKSVW